MSKHKDTEGPRGAVVKADNTGRVVGGLLFRPWTDTNYYLLMGVIFMKNKISDFLLVESIVFYRFLSYYVKNYLYLLPLVSNVDSYLAVQEDSRHRLP